MRESPPTPLMRAAAVQAPGADKIAPPPRPGCSCRHTTHMLTYSHSSGALQSRPHTHKRARMQFSSHFVSSSSAAGQQRVQQGDARLAQMARDYNQGLAAAGGDEARARGQHQQKGKDVVRAGHCRRLEQHALQSW